MAPPLLNLDGIKLTFGGTPLLDGAALTASAGDKIALVGRNGSGKSTLLKIAAGLVEAQDGEVFRQPSATIRYLWTWACPSAGRGGICFRRSAGCLHRTCNGTSR